MDKAIRRIKNWSFFHAGLITVGTILAISGSRLWILAGTGIISFTILITLTNASWTPTRSFGVGNLLTLTRLLLILWLGVCYAQFTNFLIISFSVLILIVDGIDGFIAQRREEISTFGEYFDKETDAFYLHILIMVAVFMELLPLWLVLVGLFRYFFMLYLLITGKRDKKESRSSAGRYIFVFACIAFTLPFMSIPLLYLPAVGLATVFIVFSFSRDLIWIHSGK